MTDHQIATNNIHILAKRLASKVHSVETWVASRLPKITKNLKIPEAQSKFISESSVTENNFTSWRYSAALLVLIWGVKLDADLNTYHTLHESLVLFENTIAKRVQHEFTPYVSNTVLWTLQGNWLVLGPISTLARINAFTTIMGFCNGMMAMIVVVTTARNFITTNFKSLKTNY